MEGTSIYVIWASMKQRCNNPNAHGYSDYGGRGIKVCERWAHFANFYADMGDRPEGMTLDRYPDQDGNYELGNVRWATWTEQARNRRNNCRIEGKCVIEVSESTGVSDTNIRYRLAAGYPIEQVLSPISLRKEAWKKRVLPERTHCRYGHEFDVKNTQVKITETGRTKKRCRTCSRLAAQSKKSVA